MKIIVTGGAGFIGSHIVEELLKENHEVIVIDDLSTGKKENLFSNAKFVNKSITDDLSSEFVNVDVVFHLAAIPSVQYSIEHPRETNEVNVGGTLNILELCRKNNVKKFIFTSSCAIYGETDKLPIKEEDELKPISPYALHKLIGEQYCRLYQKIYGLKTVCLRYFNVYGERQNPEGEYAGAICAFTDRLKNDKDFFIYGDGEQTRDFVYVKDVVKANFLAAFSEGDFYGEVFNIGTGKQTSVNTISNELIKLSGKDFKPIHKEPRIEPRASEANISKAQSILKWNPETKFEDGLKRVFDNS